VKIDHTARVPFPLTLSDLRESDLPDWADVSTYSEYRGYGVSESLEVVGLEITWTDHDE
jgi:hypothetical protein